MAATQTEQIVNEMLKKHKLRRTPIRIKVLSIFKSASKALTHEDIERKFDKLDRITLYRTLRAFEENGLIHKIPNSGPNPLYAICAEDCNHIEHNDEHGHFHCLECGKTFCMEDVEIPAIRLPDGFKASQRHLVMEGMCSDCSQ